MSVIRLTPGEVNKLIFTSNTTFKIRDLYGPNDVSETYQWKTEKQLDCPSGLSEEDWRLIPVAVQESILKRLGYNKEKESNKNNNRAIDL